LFLAFSVGTNLPGDFFAALVGGTLSEKK